MAVDGQVAGAIEEPGLLVLVGVTHDDTPDQAARLAAKLWGLRILDGEKSCSDIGAPLLVISQFTLYADLAKGRRPSWSAAAPGPVAEPLVSAVVQALRAVGDESPRQRRTEHRAAVEERDFVVVCVAVVVGQALEGLDRSQIIVASKCGRVPDETGALHSDLRPAAILRDLELQRPIYGKTAAYGHFGREDRDFTWERTDKADALRAAAGLLSETVA